jgi:hypothetical protein
MKSVNKHVRQLLLAGLMVVVSLDVSAKENPELPPTRNPGNEQIPKEPGNPNVDKLDMMNSTQRQMRDLYHGWTTEEGIWAEEGQNRLKRALRGTGDPEADLFTLFVGGLIPRDAIKRLIQEKGEQENREAVLIVIEQKAKELEVHVLASRARKLLIRSRVLRKRATTYRLKEAVERIKDKTPSLVGSASGAVGDVPVPEPKKE